MSILVFLSIENSSKDYPVNIVIVQEVDVQKSC